MLNWLRRKKEVVVEKPRNVEAERLALRLIKNRAKYKRLKDAIVHHAKQDAERINILTRYLIAAVAKSNGSLLIQKDLVDSLADKIETLSVKIVPVAETPGDVELKLVDMSKELQEAHEAAEEAASEE